MHIDDLNDFLRSIAHQIQSSWADAGGADLSASDTELLFELLESFFSPRNVSVEEAHPMIPTVIQEEVPERYHFRTLPNSAPMFDIGTVHEVFARAGANRKGSRQRDFMLAANNKVVVRVAYEAFALAAEDFARLVQRLPRSLQPVSQEPVLVRI